MVNNCIEVYRRLYDCISEIHEDGMCFVAPYKYEEFVDILDLKDCEYPLEAHITTDGWLAFNINELEYNIPDFEYIRDEIMKDAQK